MVSQQGFHVEAEGGGHVTTARVRLKSSSINPDSSQRRYLEIPLTTYYCRIRAFRSFQTTRSAVGTYEDHYAIKRSRFEGLI